MCHGSHFIVINLLVCILDLAELIGLILGPETKLAGFDFFESQIRFLVNLLHRLINLTEHGGALHGVVPSGDLILVLLVESRAILGRQKVIHGARFLVQVFRRVLGCGRVITGVAVFWGRRHHAVFLGAVERRGGETAHG